MIFIYISLLIVFAAISKSIMDIIEFKFSESIFSSTKDKKWLNWFNPIDSWKNKYKNRDPKQGPAFFGSTTFFVWITDAWHFFQMIMLSSFIMCIVLSLNYILPPMPTINIICADIIMFAIIKFLFGLVFQLFFDVIFKKRL